MLSQYVDSAFITPFTRGFDEVSVPAGVDNFEDVTHYAAQVILVPVN